jgi:hypothetical protein
MFRLSSLLIAGASALVSIQAGAACAYPDEPQIPDGATATEQQMVGGQQVVKAYMAEMEGYLTCLDKEAAALGDAETEEQRALHTSRHNAAVDQMEKVANSFNEQIRAFKTADR